jgi:hypothetical protein
MLRHGPAAMDLQGWLLWGPGLRGRCNTAAAVTWSSLDRWKPHEVVVAARPPRSDGVLFGRHSLRNHDTESPPVAFRHRADGLPDSHRPGGRRVECWRPSFARALGPRYTALRRDLAAYLNYYNFERAHTGRRNLGRPPAELVYGARKMRPR